MCDRPDREIEMREIRSEARVRRDTELLFSDWSSGASRQSTVLLFVGLNVNGGKLWTIWGSLSILPIYCCL
ncbi:hypothetical protein AMEX_G20965 [Astyanax mexicanus]|uniref:Uncharacterized protein n=1 Tax=Astyanax mexicanus TaxID=7994 RepID=A0A8T2KYD4_ASTMX|nr:hypothetical protein AMEX_G20965 [Astyanax mexicanus]